MRMPCAAPTPPATMTAVGVARPSAHGQAITRTAQPNMKASSWSSSTWRVPIGLVVLPSGRGMAPTAPVMAHAAQVATAMPMTTGTNTAEMRSAKAWICGLRCCASATTRMICASVESAPTAVTSTYSTPEPLMVPPTTRSSDRLGCGSDSPVIIDSSTAETPYSTRPSTGTCAPGSTLTTSPCRSPETGTSAGTCSMSLQVVSCSAVGGCRLSSCEIAEEARPLAADSRNLPSNRKVMSIAAVSNCSLPLPCAPLVASATMRKTIE
mmetsp:Transcript_26091/g.77834  ORF Transcript_26091/g.77834 Transcript_26091/m.77834 type:complete len:267 (+) Transcript_26091:989-1789(+)